MRITLLQGRWKGCAYTQQKESEMGIQDKPRSTLFGLAATCFTASMLAACMTQEDGTSVERTTESRLESENPAFNPEELLRQGLAKEAPDAPIFLGNNASEEADASSLAKTAAGPSVNITFQDPNALALIPNVNSTFVLWPGYIQSIKNSSFLYVWMSTGGPGTGLIPYGTGSHYHISWDNFCVNSQGVSGVKVNNVCTTPLPSNLNRYHIAMFGNEWLSAYSKKSGVAGTVNFNLTGIRVKGTVPISLWFKTSNNQWRYWNSLSPGRWTLPGATNIKEFQIAATSRKSSDKYSVDDIVVSTP